MLACPGCRADLDPERLAESGARHCPFCGADVSELLLTARRAVESEIFDGATPAESFRPILEKARFELVEDSAERLLIYIPGRPNPRSRSLGIFALLWNGIIGFITAMMIRQALIGAAGKGQFGALPFFSIFWIAGVIMIYAWLRLRFEKTIVLLERERLVLQQVLLQWKKIREFPITADSAATLVSSYEENKKPVYAVSLSTGSGVAKFGTTLPDRSKDWLVDRINWFLQPEKYKLSPTGDVEIRPAEVHPLTPSELANETPIQMETATVEKLRFHYPVLMENSSNPKSRVGNSIGCLAGVAVAGFMATMIGSAMKMPWPLLVIGVGLLIVSGIVALALMLFAKVTVDLDAERLECHYRLGAVGYRRRVQVSQIAAVELLPMGMSGSNGPRNPALMTRQCRVRGKDGKIVQLTFTHPESFAGTVAGLIEKRLIELGQIAPRQNTPHV